MLGEKADLQRKALDVYVFIGLQNIVATYKDFLIQFKRQFLHSSEIFHPLVICDQVFFDCCPEKHV